mmetsp:Transcript_21548/g.25408  ORF Transcript_21548/g.25408 Transcript_21548/m.25408 type:complete len:246 (+) Transcript_21548:414-1151(+)
MACVRAGDNPIGLMSGGVEANADTECGFSRQHLQSDGLETSVQAIVGLDQLCTSLLQEARPEFVLFGRLGEAWRAIRVWALPVGNAIIDGDHLPLLSMRAVEPDVIPAVLSKLVLLEEGPHAVRVLRQRCEGRDQPAIAQIALLDVTRRDMLEEAWLTSDTVELVLGRVLANHFHRTDPTWHHQPQHLLQVLAHVRISGVSCHSANALGGSGKVLVHESTSGGGLEFHLLQRHHGGQRQRWFGLR